MATKKKPGLEIDQEYELYPLDGSHWMEIRPHPDNPNTGDLDAIEESVEENGWYGAITVQKSTGFVLAGNHRFLIARKRDASHIPVLWKDVDDETATKILLADNQTAKLGVLDEDKLNELLSGLSSLRGTGYGLVGLEEHLEAEEAPEEASSGDEADAAPGEVPDDVYEPSYGIMLVCEDEDHQRDSYEALQKAIDASDPESSFGRLKLRVVAV